MIKRLLSIITSASLIASAFSFGVSAAPTAVETIDTGSVTVPEIFEEEKFEADLFSEGPSAVDIIDTAEETNTLFGEPESFGDAHLLSELEGDGTEESPFLLGSYEDLLKFADNINNGDYTDAFYKLTADIDLEGKIWTPIGYVTGSGKNTNYSKAFSGHFDGDGHTISNLSIDESATAYIGFFGYIYEGSVTDVNFDNANINIESPSKEITYVGIISGKVVTNSENARINITNCNITNSKINIVNNGTIYAGGLIGSAVADEGSNGGHVFLAFCDVQCDINAETKSTKIPGTVPGTNILDQNDCDLVAAGGLTGYFGAFIGTRISAINCHTNCNIYTSALNGKYCHAFSGGAFGNLRANDGKVGGSIYIDSCYTEGTAVADSDYMPYKSGGFAAQLMATNDTYISNCYAASDASGTHLDKGRTYDPVAGGFIGMVEFNYYSTGMGKKIFNCYASGDAVDLTYTSTDPKDSSFVGGFAGWSTAGIFKNSYKLATQKLAGTDIFNSDVPTLSEEDIKYEDKYVGFDFENIWEMDTSSEYPYPTLIEKTGFVEFFSEGVSFSTYAFGTDGKVKEPDRIPEKESTVDKTYEFNYWSLTENGTPFNFGSETVSENTILHAVFKENTRYYTIGFICNGVEFAPAQSIPYGSLITPPEGTPVREDDEIYYYEFSHWSQIIDGQPADFSTFTVSGDQNFYAVFEAFDKSAWRGGIAESFSSGHGTKNAPYIITNCDEFALFAKVINDNLEGYADAYYALGTDVNLGGNIWTPIGRSESIPFSAHFDGRGYSISNFILSDNKYVGIFGYVLNATITNVHIRDFEFLLSTERESEEKYSMYAGGLIGLLAAKDGFSSTISKVYVSDAEFDIDVKVGYLYLSNVIGKSHAEAKSKINIYDSFSSNNISAKNPGGYIYAGGITGMGEMGSKSDFLINRCYSTGSITVESYNSSYIGGIVGHLKSHGSAYSPEVGGTYSEEDASLSNDDTDIMISNCFAVTSITAKKTYLYADLYLGFIVGEINQYATYKNIVRPLSAGIFIDPSLEDTKMGSNTDNKNLMKQDYLEANFGFDFENTWIFVPGSKYPVLKSMVINKPGLRMDAVLGENDDLEVNVQVTSPVDEYTIVIGVYNERNQLIKSERRSFNALNKFNEFDITYENMKKAVKVAVSAIEKSSLKPLFECVYADLTETEE